MTTTRGRPKIYTAARIAEAADELRRETGHAPGADEIRERLGGGSLDRIRSVIEGIEIGARGRSDAATPADPGELASLVAGTSKLLSAERAASPGMTLLQDVLSSVDRCLATQIDSRVMAAREADAAATDARIKTAVEAARSDDVARMAALEDRVSELEAGQRRSDEALRVMGDGLTDIANRIVGCVDKVMMVQMMGASRAPCQASPRSRSGGSAAKRAVRSGRSGDASTGRAETSPVGRSDSLEAKTRSGADRIGGRTSQAGENPSRVRPAASSSGEGDRRGGCNEVPASSAGTLPVAGAGPSRGGTSSCAELPRASSGAPIRDTIHAGGAVVSGPWRDSRSGLMGSSCVPPGSA